MDPYQNYTEAALRAELHLKPGDPLAWCRMSEKFIHPPREHLHHYYQIYYVRRGSAQYLSEGKNLSLTRGDCIIVTPEVVHFIAPEKDSAFTCTSFYMQIFPPLMRDEPLLQRFFEFVSSNTLPHKLNLSDSELLYMDQLTAFMSDEDSREDEGYKNVLLCILTAILTLLARALFRERRQSKHSGAMLDTLEYINTHFESPISGAELAKKLFLSESTFYRVFKRMTGHSFKDYLTSTRIRNACKLLREKNLSFAAVAAECGYGDYSAFYRAFYSVMQMTPSAYQQREIPAEIASYED